MFTDKLTLACDLSDKSIRSIVRVGTEIYVHTRRAERFEVPQPMRAMLLAGLRQAVEKCDDIDKSLDNM